MMAKQSKSNSQPQNKTFDPQQELVDPVWMLKALAAVVLLAGVCAYIVICALFYRSQWQIVLSPSRTITTNPGADGLPYESVHFDPGSDGQPRLSGWWIPAAQRAAPVALVMQGGSGNMGDMLRQASLLHNAQLNVLLFDYRGFGNSNGKHPSENQMQQDSEAALSYLSNFRRIPASDVIAFGEGLGASLATRLCTEHNELSALILENADGDFESRAVLDTRSRLVPVSLLFNQKFPLADPLHSLATPKLLISYTKNGMAPIAFARAGDPKLTAEVNSPENAAALSATLRRFLDSYVAHPPAALQP